MSARTDRNIAPLLFSLIATWGLASGCTKAGRSIVQVHVTADPAVGALDTVQLSAMQGSQSVRAATSFDWTTGGISVGLYLPADVSGDVQIIGEGFSGSMRVARSSDSSGHVTVTAGQNTDVVSLVLLPVPANPDGGNPDGGGAGAGGAAGAGGRGGADAGMGTGGNAESAAMEPVAMEPAAMEPVAMEPVAMEPAAMEPAAVPPMGASTLDWGARPEGPGRLPRWWKTIAPTLIASPSPR